jgi:hypothetical protein
MALFHNADGDRFDYDMCLRAGPSSQDLVRLRSYMTDSPVLVHWLYTAVESPARSVASA